MGIDLRHSYLPLTAATAPTMRHDPGAVNEQSKALLETARYINEQIPLVQCLRRQRSSYLSSSEKVWIDNAIENVSSIINGIHHSADPIPETLVSKQRRFSRPALLHKMRYFVRDSPQVSIQLGQLSIATQSLNTAMSVLSASVNGPLSGHPAVLESGTHTLDSPWNELNELVRRRRFNDSLLMSNKAYLATAQRSNLEFPADNRFEQQGLRIDDYPESSPADDVKNGAQRCRLTCTPADDLPPAQNNINSSLETVTDHRINDGLTLIIDTVEDWRHTTERALDNINALSAALTSSLRDQSMANTLHRTRLHKVPQHQIPRRKPVPGLASSTGGLLPPPRPILEPSLRNSFDKEPLPQDEEHRINLTKRVNRTQDVSTPFGTSPSTVSLFDVSNSSENASTSTLSTAPPQSYQMSRGRVLLERRIMSFEEELEEEDNVCLLER